MKKLFSRSFSPPGQMIWEIMDCWVAGWVLCKLFKFLQTYSITSSNYMILALSVERHRFSSMKKKFVLFFFIIFQGRHQASLCDQLTLQVRQMVRLGTHDGSLLII